jgi:hypothetical protein
MKNNNEQANYYVDQVLVYDLDYDDAVSRLADVVNRERYELKEKNKSIESANKNIKFPVCGAWGLRYE